MFPCLPPSLHLPPPPPQDRAHNMEERNSTQALARFCPPEASIPLDLEKTDQNTHLDQRHKPLRHRRRNSVVCPWLGNRSSRSRCCRVVRVPMSSLSLHTALPGAGRHWWPPPWCTTCETQHFPVPWLRESGHWDASFSREETLAWGLERTLEVTLETEVRDASPSPFPSVTRGLRDHRKHHRSASMTLTLG